MYLWIDECCSDGLRTVAEKLGHVAQLTKQIEALGRGQDDRVIFDFAREHAVLVTVNAADFRDLARYRGHPGVILLPSVREPEQSRLFRRVFGSGRRGACARLKHVPGDQRAGSDPQLPPALIRPR